MHWMFLPFKRYFDFQGRSRRMEFWMFALLNFILAAILLGPLYSSIFSAALYSDPATPGAESGVIGAAISTGGIAPILAGLYGIYALVAFIPSIAVTVRRLHDRNMSGWWYLGFIVLSMIPYVGFLVTIAFVVIMALPGTPGPNRFGPSPKEEISAQTFE